MKEWYSLEDAANRLSLTLSETVTVKEVLELALDGNMKLYWFIRHVPAIEVKLVQKEVPFLTEKSRRQTLQDAGIDPETSNIKTFVTQSYSPIDENCKVSYLDGPHHLRLQDCGALSDYLRSFLTNTGGELVSLEGYQVEDHEGKVWSICERFHDEGLTSSDNWNEEARGTYHYHSSHNYYPSGQWPNFSELGFTKLEINNLEKNIQGKDSNEITTREHKALLKMILGMAIEQYGYKPDAARNEATRNIENDLREAGFPLSEDTVRKYLKMAKNIVLDGLDE
ncbi:MAG: hypothetical protein ABJM86_07360 [Hyphomicrobiales bacterium]